MNESNVLDLEYLRSVTEGDSALEQHLFDLFRKTAAKCTRVMEESIATQNALSWKESAHELKGSSAYLGASRLKDACFAAEKGGLANASALLAALKIELELVLEALENAPKP